MLINKDQRIILFTACFFTLLTFIFPPIAANDLNEPVAWGRLIFLQLSIVLTTLGLLLAFKD